MNCEEFENLMVINIYGKLTSQEKNDFDDHLQGCLPCALKYERLKSQENILVNNESQEPDWEKSWEIIAQKSIKQKRMFDLYHQKYALATVTLVLVFLIGFMAGKKIFLVQPQQPLISSDHFSELSLQSFAEDLEPIFIDFLNRGDQPIPEEFENFEKRIVSEMLVKTKLLRYIMQKRGNSQLVQLLEDIEFVLLNLSNLRPEDSLSTKQIQQFIRDKNLRFLLKLVANEKVTI